MKLQLCIVVACLICSFVSNAWAFESSEDQLIIANLHFPSPKNCSLQHVDALTGKVIKNIAQEEALCQDASLVHGGVPIVKYSPTRQTLFALPGYGVKFVHRINAITGEALEPLPLPTKDVVLGMEYSDSRHEVYIVTKDTVYTIDVETGKAKEVAQGFVFDSVYSVALYDELGILFLGEGVYNGNGVLTGVDLNTHKVSNVTLPAQLNLCLMLQYSPTNYGELFWLDRLNYYRVPFGTFKPEKFMEVPNSDGYPSKATFDPEKQQLVLSALFNIFVLDTKNGKVLSNSKFDGYHSIGFSLLQ